MVGNVSSNKLKIHWLGRAIRTIVSRSNGKFALLKRNLWNNKSKQTGTTPIPFGKSFTVVSLKNLFHSFFFSGDVNIVANEFNNFFVNIGKNTIQKISTWAEQFQCEAHHSSFTPREYPVSEQFVFHAIVNINQIQNIIESMATNKSPVIDKTPIRVIKDCLSAILPSITSIINATFLSAQFPTVWKIAEVTPILKDGDRDIPNDYRPILLLPVLSKICERIAHDQLTSFLIANQRL